MYYISRLLMRRDQKHDSICQSVLCTSSNCFKAIKALIKIPMQGNSQILTVDIRNERKKKTFIICNVPESQTACFPLFPSLTTFHTNRVARQPEVLNYFACELGLAGNRRKRNRNGVADFYLIFSLCRVLEGSNVFHCQTSGPVHEHQKNGILSGPLSCKNFVFSLISLYIFWSRVDQEQRIQNYLEHQQKALQK